MSLMGQIVDNQEIEDGLSHLNMVDIFKNFLINLKISNFM